MKQKKAILAVSFGTSYKKARESAIGGIEQALLQAFPEYELRRCFTSGMVIRHIKDSEGILIDDPQKALSKAAADGVTELLVQPTHVMSGSEYRKFMKELALWKDQFEQVKVGEPLLSSPEDYRQLADAVTQSTVSYADGKTAVILVGHGSETEADQVYEKLQRYLKEENSNDYYVGTIESKPSAADLLNCIREKSYQRVLLVPLMIVAGDHAVHDIAGEEGSWKQIFESAGYEVITLLKGLGEYRQIQDIYTRHLMEAEMLS